MLREFQVGDTVRLKPDDIVPNLTPGKEYAVLHRGYVGGHADCYVLRLTGDDGKVVDQIEDSFELTDSKRKQPF